MKKSILALFLSMVFFSSCECLNGKKESEDERRIRVLAKYKKLAKEMLLPNYSDVRVLPNVLSEKETMNVVLDDAFSIDYDHYARLLEETPSWKDAEVGNLILVQELTPGGKEINPYYYIIFAQLKGWIIGQATVKAVTDGKRGEFAGKIGMGCFANDTAIPSRFLTKNEAIAFLKNKFAIDTAVNAEVKAVKCGNDQFDWGWAVKFDLNIDLKPFYNKDVRANVFWLHPEVFDETWVSSRTGESAYSYMARRYKKDGRIGYFDKDPFDPHVLQAVKEYKWPEIPRDLPDEEIKKRRYQAFDEWEKIAPMLTTLE